VSPTSIFSPRLNVSPLTWKLSLLHLLQWTANCRNPMKLPLLFPRPKYAEALSDAFVWRLSRTSGLSREQRGLERPNWHRGSPRHTWLGHNFEGQKVRVTRPLYSPPCWCIRQLQRWAWERVGCEKLLLRCRLLTTLSTGWRWGTTAPLIDTDRRPGYNVLITTFTSHCSA